MRRIIVVTAAGGLIATVVGGVILDVIPRPSELLTKLVSGASNGVYWVWAMLASSYSIPSWAMLVVGVLALVGLTFIGILIRKSTRSQDERPYQAYTEDNLDGVVWRWCWAGGRVGNLWCYCPTCDAQLVYSDSLTQTNFICERCPFGRIVNRVWIAWPDSTDFRRWR